MKNCRGQERNHTEQQQTEKTPPPPAQLICYSWRSKSAIRGIYIHCKIRYTPFIPPDFYYIGTTALSECWPFWRIFCHLFETLECCRTPCRGGQPVARPLYLRRATQHRKTRTNSHASNETRTHDPALRTATEVIPLILFPLNTGCPKRYIT
jgi:hypothetical protein